MCLILISMFFSSSGKPLKFELIGVEACSHSNLFRICFNVQLLRGVRLMTLNGERWLGVGGRGKFAIVLCICAKNRIPIP